MADIMTPAARSQRMSLIRGKNTGPELAIRRILHRLGYRFRLHARGLPGKPDIVFPPRRKAVFIHGCFWHQHPGCSVAHVPETRRDYWMAKFKRTVQRDAQSLSRIRALGWDALIIWECGVRDTATVAMQLTRFLGAPKRQK